MIQAVLFRNVQPDVHLSIKAKSIVIGTPAYVIYNNAMKGFSKKVKSTNYQIEDTDMPKPPFVQVRVEKIDREIYKKFKIACIQKDISISQGINLALVSWLEGQEDDISSLELRT